MHIECFAATWVALAAHLRVPFVTRFLVLAIKIPRRYEIGVTKQSFPQTC